MRTLVIHFGAGGLLLAGSLLALWLDGRIRFALPLPVVGWLVMMTGLWSFGRWNRKRQRIAAANFRLCPHCEYSLRGLDDRGECPECGRAYDVEAARAQARPGSAPDEPPR